MVLAVATGLEYRKPKSDLWLCHFNLVLEVVYELQVCLFVLFYLLPGSKSKHPTQLFVHIK